VYTPGGGGGPLTRYVHYAPSLGSCRAQRNIGPSCARRCSYSLSDIILPVRTYYTLLTTYIYIYRRQSVALDRYARTERERVRPPPPPPPSDLLRSNFRRRDRPPAIAAVLVSTYCLPVPVNGIFPSGRRPFAPPGLRKTATTPTVGARRGASASSSRSPRRDGIFGRRL